MAASFDPYREWLGINPEEHRNHYRLLGVNIFEDKPNVISLAADSRMSVVRTFQTGPHAAESQDLLKEITKARICLPHPAKKAEYDGQLRDELRRRESVAASPAEKPLIAFFGNELEPAGSSAPGSPATAGALLAPPGKPREKFPAKILGLVVAGCSALLIAVLLLIAFGGRDQPDAADPLAEPAAGQAKQSTPAVAEQDIPPADVRPDEGPPASDADSAVEPQQAGAASVEKTASGDSAASGGQNSIDLLELIDPQRDVVSGQWSREGDSGAIVSRNELHSRVQIPFSPPREYALKVEGLREEGEDLAIGLVVGGKQVLVTFDGWGWSLSGLSLVDGLHADKNETGKQINNVLGDKQNYTLLCTVRSHSLTVEVNGQTVVNWPAGPERLSMVPEWAIPQEDKLFIGSKRAVHRIHGITLTPLGTAANTLHAEATVSSKKVYEGYLSDLPLLEAKYRPDKPLKSLVTVAGFKSPHGIFLQPDGDNSSAHAAFDIGKRYARFDGQVAINDGAGPASTELTFRIVGDGRELWKSAPLNNQDAAPPQAFRVDVAGVSRLELFVDCPGPAADTPAVWVEPRLTTAAAFRSVEKQTPINLDRDVGQGQWRWTRDELYTQGWATNSAAGLSLPYQPPAEYDFILEFTVLQPDNDVAHWFDHDGKRYDWILGGWNNRRTGLNINGSLIEGADRSPFFQPHHRYRSVVQLRNSGLAMFLNGERLGYFPGEASNNSTPEAVKPGIMTFNPTVFHSIRITAPGGRVLWEGTPSAFQLGTPRAPDMLELAVDEMAGRTSTMSAQEAPALTGSLLAAFERAAEGDRPELQDRVKGLLREVFKKADERTLEADAWTKVEALEKGYQGVRSALERMKSDPEDEAANLIVGRFYCFTKRDWAKGLPLLARGSDRAWATAATNELAISELVDGPQAQAVRTVEVADDWWNISLKLPAGASASAAVHALDLYASVVNSTTNTTPRRVGIRLMDSAPNYLKAQATTWALSLDGKNPTDLILQPDGSCRNGSVSGTWKIRKNVIQMRWGRDQVDTVTLSLDYQSLQGTNQAGSKLSAQRKPNP